VIELRSFAKLNLGLEITGKRPDGYHTLRTVFQTIDLHDTIRICERNDTKIVVSGSDKNIDWGETNTICRAAALVARNFPLSCGFDIEVEKRIPAGAGLGGGSSNAALILLFLNAHAGLGLSVAQLIELAVVIGADVPFFILGGTALAEGVGEKLTPLADLPRKEIILAIPPLHVSTASVFSRFTLTKAVIPSKIQTFLRAGTISILENELEAVTMSLFPEIGALKDKMSEMGFEFVQMTGSGCALFGVTPSDRARHLAQTLPGSINVRTVGRQTYQERIGVWPSGKASAFGAEIRRFESSRPSFHP
jgi:4-diphosphocytidyl-2-C-methyl-D-erythritol kinase